MAELSVMPEGAHYGDVRSSRDHDLDELTDLAVAAQNGDRAALGAFSRALQQPVYRLALDFSGHPIDAEDVALEVMLRLLTTLEAYDSQTRLTTWVYANAVRQLLRSESRAGEAGDGPGTDGGPSGLPRPARIAYLLVDLHGFSVDEAAEIAAIGPADFRERLELARAELGRWRAEAAPPDEPELDVPESVWSRLVATMPSHLGAE